MHNLESKHGIYQYRLVPSLSSQNHYGAYIVLTLDAYTAFTSTDLSRP